MELLDETIQVGQQRLVPDDSRPDVRSHVVILSPPQRTRRGCARRTRSGTSAG
jgi:hypothetical protein